MKTGSRLAPFPRGENGHEIVGTSSDESVRCESCLVEKNQAHKMQHPVNEKTCLL